MPTPLIDGHTHIDQHARQDLPALLERARAAGVRLIIAAGTTLASCAAVQRLAEEAMSAPATVMVRAGVGLHPQDLKAWVDGSTQAQLRVLASQRAVVEWSETGLDYQPSSPPWDLQQDAFRKQARIARDLGLPMVIHSRGSDPDMLRLLREEGVSEAGGAWHYFQGDLPLAERIMELGMFVSLAKPLLRLPDLQAVAARLPLDRIVLETDSYPQPFKKHRDRWTEPCDVPLVAAKLAELHGVSVQRVAEVTTANTLRMLKGRVRPEELATVS